MLFTIEITDTFAGESNYSWVRRYKTEAKSFRGAIQKLAKHYGSGWKIEFNGGDICRYNLSGACVCCFIQYADDEYRNAGKEFETI